MDLLSQVIAARKCGTPLLAINTVDPGETVMNVARGLNGQDARVQWDCIRGFRAVGGDKAWASASQKALAQALVTDKDTFPVITAALQAALKFPEGTIVFFQNMHRFLDNALVAQAVWNLRDQFKQNRRTAFLLGPDMRTPLELHHDVMVLDDPLPNDSQIRSLLDEVVRTAKDHDKTGKFAVPKQTLDKAVDAVRGLSSFSIEQITYMSVIPKGLDLDMLWSRKRAAIEQTRGLSVDPSREELIAANLPATFSDMGGCAQAILTGQRIFTGHRPPRLIVRIDEMEKYLAGATGLVQDNTGVAQDQLGEILQRMVQHQWRGMILVGPPGSGKTMYSQLLGTTYGVPTIRLDLGGAKDMHLGQSEALIRAAMKVIHSVAGDSAFFVATCNKLDVIPPELRRRFKRGIWYCSLPSEGEKEAIWDVNLRRYGLTIDKDNPKPNDHLWTGADIANCCETAWELSIPLVDAASDYIVPVALSDPKSIDDLEDAANGHFLSAAYPGKYRKPDSAGEPVGKVRARMVE